MHKCCHPLTLMWSVLWRCLIRLLTNYVCPRKSLGAAENSTDKTDMKEVDVSHIEPVMSVWYIKDLLKAKKVSLSQVACSGAVRWGRCTCWQIQRFNGQFQSNDLTSCTFFALSKCLMYNTNISSSIWVTSTSFMSFLSVDIKNDPSDPSTLDSTDSSRATT